MSSSHLPNGDRNSGEAPLLPAGSVRSVVTLNSPSCHRSLRPTSLSNRRRRGLPIDLCSRGVLNPSVAIASVCCNDPKGKLSDGHGIDGERTTLVATCTSANGDDSQDEGTSTKGRISLATIAENPLAANGIGCRVAGMQYSPDDTSSFSAVGIVPCARQDNGAATQQPHSILFATDISGRLHTCHLIQGGDEQRLLDMQECTFNERQDTPKRGKKAKSTKKPTETSDGRSLPPPLSMTNNLTARLGSGGRMIQPTHEKSPPKSSPTKGKGRKRKLEGGTTAQSDSIHLVASNIDHCIPASQSPPIVMLLSSSGCSEADGSGASYQCSGMAWSEVPGLENVHVPMTCILFASRLKVGPQIWKGIISAIESNSSADTDDDECDAGVVLMGFQDGTVRASIVISQPSASKGPARVTVAASEATTILQLGENEPLVSLNMPLLAFGSDKSAAAAPGLLCIGAMGTVISLSSFLGPRKPASIPKFAIEQSLKPRGGRWVSMECVGCRFLDNRDCARSSPGALESPTAVVSFVAVNDSRQTFLCHSMLGQSASSVDGTSRHGGEYNSQRLPISAASSVHCHPGPTRGTFVVSSPGGKVLVLSLDKSSLSGPQSSSSDQIAARPNEIDRISNPNKSGSTVLESVIQQLRSANMKQSRCDTEEQCDAVNHQSNHAMKEIRSATQMAALVNRSFKSMPPPFQCEVKTLNAHKPGIVECRLKAGSLTAQQPDAWLPSTHVLQSCTQALSPMLRAESIGSMPPLCYRRTLRGDGRPTAVGYGGTATSYNACDVGDSLEDTFGRLSIDVGLNDFIPASVYASLSMVFAEDDTGWTKSSKAQTGIDPLDLHCLTSLARACSQRGSRSERTEFLGASLPFEVAAGVNILTCLTSSDHPALSSMPGEKDPRCIAEMLVRQMHPNRPSEYVMPLLKEKQWILSAANHGVTDDAKVHCCSSSMRSTSIQGNVQNDCCANVGLGSLSIARRDTLVGFAIGSDVLSPNEAMAFLPVMRQAIVRQALQSSASVTLVDRYHQLLNEKQTSKVAKYVSRTSEELLNSIGDASNDYGKVSNQTLATALSLYEIMRAIDIVF